jgi:hypothetical protein
MFLIMINLIKFLRFCPAFVFLQPALVWAGEQYPDALSAGNIQPGCNLKIVRYGYDPSDVKKYGLSLNWQCADSNPSIVDSYAVDNVSPEVVTVFYTKKRDVVVLVRWKNQTQDSVTTRYKVFAYRYVGDISDTPFVRLDRLSERFGEGFDGIVNGKQTEYPFKTAADIRKRLAEFGE